jgi:hypothetical protein
METPSLKVVEGTLVYKQIIRGYIGPQQNPFCHQMPGDFQVSPFSQRDLFTIQRCPNDRISNTETQPAS